MILYGWRHPITDSPITLAEAKGRTAGLHNINCGSSHVPHVHKIETT